MAIVHGGDIAQAMALAQTSGFDPGTASDWLDLSTGVNPVPYPLEAIPPACFHRLPEQADMAALLHAAADYYQAPSVNHVVAAGGSALLIRMLPVILADWFSGPLSGSPDRAVAILGPTYGDHSSAWASSGQSLRPLSDLDEARPSEITVIVNPNNPDGRIVPHAWLARHAEKAAESGGLLIVDEAFGDVMTTPSAVDLVVGGAVIVLKSVGKFFGLAGLRLGFAIAPPDLCHCLHDHLGAWAVSGPALHLGKRALEDRAFHARTRQHLTEQSARLAGLFAAAGFSAERGTALFRLIESDDAPQLFLRLLQHHIYVRRFDYDSRWLRVGLPGDPAGFQRLEQALCR